MAKSKKDNYKLVLTMKDGEVFNADGVTVLEAMEKISLEPNTMGVLTLSLGDKTSQRMLNASVLKRLFSVKLKSFVKKNALVIYSKFLTRGLF